MSLIWAKHRSNQHNIITAARYMFGQFGKCHLISEIIFEIINDKGNFCKHMFVNNTRSSGGMIPLHDDVIKWNHFPRYLPLCGEFSGHRRIPLTKASVFIHLCLNKRLSKQSRSWWLETPSRSLWHHCNADCRMIAGTMETMFLMVEFGNHLPC